MNKVFGIKENAEYYDRRGAYIIPIREGKVGVVKTPKGYFFIGGGLEQNETDRQCIQRESLEETGFQVKIEKYICSAESFLVHSRIGYFHPIQNYYSGELIEKIQDPKEGDHVLQWVEYGQMKGKMYSEMQSWALAQAWKKHHAEQRSDSPRRR